jgi:outer membrane translocation and assembly module TamA
MSRIPALVDIRKSVCLLLLATAFPAHADVAYVVVGLDETLTANVLSHVDTVQFGPRARLRPRDHEKVIDKAIGDARAALLPYGYYAPDISARIIEKQDRSAIVELTIEAGPPVRIGSVDVSVVGPGASDRLITRSKLPSKPRTRAATWRQSSPSTGSSWISKKIRRRSC